MVSKWVHGEVDELDQVIPCLLIGLRPGESVEKTLLFCVEWVDILDFDVPENRLVWAGIASHASFASAVRGGGALSDH